MDPKGAIEKFRQITGSDEPTANFYMEANRWDIAQATESYFEAGGESVPASTAANAASAKSSMSSPSPATATSKPSSSRIATFKDLSRGGGGSDHDDDEDNDDNEEGPEYYAGGEKSGVAVKGPPTSKKKKNEESDDDAAAAGAPDLIKQILKQAAQAGPPPSDFKKKAGESSSFKGTGFKLGQENELSTAVKPAPKTAATDMDLDEVVERKLTFWKNGFNIDDGELRKYDDPENEEFLKAIKSGRAPIHMLNVAPGQAVEVKVDHRMEQDYVKVFKTFGGSGQRLGAPTPSLISSSSSSSSSAGAVASLPGSFPTSSSFSSSTPTAAAITTTSSTPAALVSSATSLNVDESKPITSIQIRLGDGTRMVSRFNHTHLVRDIRNFINASRPGESARRYALMTTFPNKELTDDTLSIKDANLVNAVIVQKYV